MSLRDNDEALDVCDQCGKSWDRCHCGDVVGEDEDEDGSCYLCGGDGFEVTCCDDICHGQGFCMHGDGNENCPACNKDGDKEWIL